jgi:hypothetical protein
MLIEFSVHTASQITKERFGAQFTIAFEQELWPLLGLPPNQPA